MKNKKYTVDSIELYKEMYYNELNRKKDFESLLNTPILTYSFIITINYVMVSNTFFGSLNRLPVFIEIFMGIIGLVLLISITYLLLFYHNFLKSYNYLEISNPEEILKMEKDLKEEQERYEYAEIHFQEKLKNMFAEYAGYNMKINVKRLKFLSSCKFFLIIAVILTIINSLNILLIYGEKF